MWHPEREKNKKILTDLIKKLKKMIAVILCAGRGEDLILKLLSVYLKSKTKH